MAAIPTRPASVTASQSLKKRVWVRVIGLGLALGFGLGFGFGFGLEFGLGFVFLRFKV